MAQGCQSARFLRRQRLRSGPISMRQATKVTTSSQSLKVRQDSLPGMNEAMTPMRSNISARLMRLPWWAWQASFYALPRTAVARVAPPLCSRTKAQPKTVANFPQPSRTYLRKAALPPSPEQIWLDCQRNGQTTMRSLPEPQETVSHILTTANHSCKKYVQPQLIENCKQWLTMNLSDRIKKRLEATGKTQAGLARHVGVKPPSVSKWMNGETKNLEGMNLLRASDFLECSPTWLAQGKGLEVENYGVRAGSALIPSSAAVRSYDDYRDLDPEKYVFVKSYSIGLSAGNGNFAWIEHEDDPLVFRASFFKARKLKPENCRALRVSGRSMEPALDDGDAVMIDTSKIHIVDGEIYAVMVQGELFIKYVDRLPGGIRLRSANEAFKPMDLTQEQLESFTVLGKKEWAGG